MELVDFMQTLITEGEIETVPEVFERMLTEHSDAYKNFSVVTGSIAIPGFFYPGVVQIINVRVDDGAAIIRYEGALAFEYAYRLQGEVACLNEAMLSSPAIRQSFITSPRVIAITDLDGRSTDVYELFVSKGQYKLGREIGPIEARELMALMAIYEDLRIAYWENDMAWVENRTGDYIGIDPGEHNLPEVFVAAIYEEPALSLPQSEIFTIQVNVN